MCGNGVAQLTGDSEELKMTGWPNLPLFGQLGPREVETSSSSFLQFGILRKLF